MQRSISFIIAGAIGALWGLLAPFSFIFVAEEALTRSSISHETYLELIPWTKAVMAPGLGLAKIIGSEPYFWVSHSSGPLFLKNVAVLGVSNAISWAGISCAFSWAIGKMKYSRLPT